MTKQICTWLSLSTLLLALFLALPVYAQEQEQTYIIKKGDTLWGISERFINDPYYWPNLWSHNPDITNPHLIYPGQEIRLINGKLVVVPTYDGAQPAQEEKAESDPQAAEETAEEPLEPSRFENTPIPKDKTIFKTAGGSEGFILADEKPLGVIIDSVDNRTLLMEEDTVFLEMKNAAGVGVGDVFGIYKRGAEIIHPVTKKKYGNMMHDLGYLVVTGIDRGTVTAKIGKAYREVERGAELYDYIPPIMEISLKRTENEMQGHILSTQSEKLTQGQQDVVFIDLGLEDGLVVGNMLYIGRPRTITEKGLQQPSSPLPYELLGAAVVIESRAQTAAALIVKSVKTIYKGDQVQTIAE